ncbi:MAG: hypothetical protein IE933_12575 [Sphingomonadales bacterium]|nr:hypothetical protein [Sphingomonadales bacterium]MBD3774661.1 hypothetical protein [Paracoccaceae bacterium]
MPNTLDATAWSATLLGLFAVAAAIGALRQPGAWRRMIDEIEKSPALQLVSGFMELFVGAAIYLGNPWVPSELLTCVMKTIGGLMIIEALAVMAISDLYFQIWLKTLAAVHRGWAIVTLVLGLALTVAGTMHFS